MSTKAEQAETKPVSIAMTAINRPLGLKPKRMPDEDDVGAGRGRRMPGSPTA